MTTLPTPATDEKRQGMTRGDGIALAAILVPIIVAMIVAIVGAYGQVLLTKAAVDRHEMRFQKVDDLNDRMIRVESKVDAIGQAVGAKHP